MKYRPIGWYISRRKTVKTSVTKLGFGSKKRVIRWLDRSINCSLTALEQSPFVPHQVLNFKLRGGVFNAVKVATRIFWFIYYDEMLNELQWSELLIIRSRSLYNKQSLIASQHQVLYVQEETRHRLNQRSRHKRFPGLADRLIVGKEGKHSCEFVHSSQVLLRQIRNLFNSRNGCGL